MNLPRIWIALAVMGATIMQALDTTIVNVALPHMTGDLGATTDTISWVLTSYLIGSAVFMPLSGFLTDRLGRKKYLLIAIAGFVATSALCGLAQSLPEMVLFRLLQGVFGASLAPLSQAIMLDTFPPESRGKSMALWAMGVMVAPVLGPTLGGWLTEVSSWRWTFYINIPVGIVSILLVMRYVPETALRERRMDWLSFSALAVGLIFGQVVLDQGASLDWFDSAIIRSSAVAAAVGLAFFVWRSLTAKSAPLFDLRVLKDRNFAVASFIATASGLGMFGGMLLLPIYLENLLGYPTVDAGLALMPRGIAMFVSMGLVGKLTGRFKPRDLILAGLVMSCAGAWLMTGISPDADGSVLFWPMVLQGMGMGFLFVPNSTLGFATIPRNLTTEAAGLYSMVRTIGSAVGIAVASTWLGHMTSVNWAELRASITPFSHQAAGYLARLHGAGQGLDATILAGVVQQQASVAAFVNTFWLIAASFVAMFPLLLLIKPIPKGAGAAPAAVMHE
jgi:DHA2 family multidrug resistance protein